MIEAVLDSRDARRRLRRIEKALGTAEQRALALAASNVRKAYIAGIKGNKPKAMPASVQKINKPWREILHPSSVGKPQGGGLTQPQLWPSHYGAHSATVDILTPYQRTLAHYQSPPLWHVDILRVIDFVRAQRSNVVNTGYMTDRVGNRGLSRSQKFILGRIKRYLLAVAPQHPDPGLMRHYRGYGNPTYERIMIEDFTLVCGIDSLPKITPAKPRDVVSHVRRWAGENMGDWYLSILKKLTNGAIKPFSKRSA